MTTPDVSPALTSDLAAVRQDAYTETGLRLLAIADPDQRRAAAAAEAKHASADLATVRAQRDRAIVELWAFGGLDGHPLHTAAPLMERRTLYLIKTKALGTKTLPTLPGTNATDHDAIRAVLAARGYGAEGEHAAALARSLHRIERLTGQSQAARDVRDYLLACLVTDGGLSHQQAGKVMGMTQQHVSKTLAHAHRTAAPVGMREQNWVQRIPALLARAGVERRDVEST